MLPKTVADFLSCVNNFQKLLLEKYNISYCFGIEVEFYLSGNTSEEEGKHQYEFSIQHSLNFSYVENQVVDLKQTLNKMAEDCKLQILFTAKPFISQPG